MKITSIYPVIMTDDVAAVAAFFVENFGFETVFATDWYVSLRKDSWEMAVLAHDHPTVPTDFRNPVAGLLINIEVENADAEFDRLVVQGGQRPLLPIRSEEFGQRHFILQAPGGVMVDVIQPIPFTGAYAESQ